MFLKKTKVTVQQNTDQPSAFSDRKHKAQLEKYSTYIVLIAEFTDLLRPALTGVSAVGPAYFLVRFLREGSTLTWVQKVWRKVVSRRKDLYNVGLGVYAPVPVKSLTSDSNN